jgi:hypothetical protein
MVNLENLAIELGKKCVGTVSRAWEMTKNAWGRFPKCGKWQKMRGDGFPSVGNGIFYGRKLF